MFNIPARWNKFSGLPALDKRGFLRHTRHLSIAFPHDPLFVHDLRLYTRHLRTLTNPRSFETRWLDIPSFITKVEEYFGAFFGTLQSLELESPRGDYKPILYFVCQLPNLQDLRVDGVQDCPSSICNGGPHLEIKTSTPLDGILDLQLDMDGTEPGDGSIGAQLFLSNLIALPSDLKFRVLKLSGCTGNNLQRLVDACAPTLEDMEFTGRWFGALSLHGGEYPLFTSIRTISLSGTRQCPQLSFKRHSALRELEIKLADRAHIESASGRLSETLSTITSNAFTKLTVYIALVPFMVRNAAEIQLREWNSFDNALDRFNLCDNVIW